MFLSMRYGYYSGPARVLPLSKTMVDRVQRMGAERGYSTLEMLATVGIMGTVAAMAAFQIGVARSSYKGDGALRTVVAQLGTARELAIAERRFMRVEFTTNNEVRITREEVPAGTTVISTVPLEGGLQFGLTGGVPDTPDNFGNTAAIAFGAATLYRFTSEGTLVNESGSAINGSVFLNWPGAGQGQERAARAVTVLGATGRIRGYRWDGRSWKRV